MSISTMLKSLSCVLIFPSELKVEPRVAGGKPAGFLCQFLGVLECEKLSSKAEKMWLLKF